MNIEKRNINPGSFDRKKMLDELSIDISNKFGINKEQIKKLIKLKTLESIDSLKKEILINNTNNGDNINNKKLEQLFFTLKGALDVIENNSKIEIKILKENIESNINILDFKNNIEKYLPPNILKKAKNPSNSYEHILGFSLGTVNSIYKTADILYQIGKGVLQTPYHLYLIISNKASTDSFKNI